MAQRRPITSHPAFVPLLAVWFAALFGLIVAVLPGTLLVRVLRGVGVEAAAPLTIVAWVAAIGAAAFVGVLVGLVVAIPTARRGSRDPRPIYSEQELAYDMPEPAPVRRPLNVREELVEDMSEAAFPAAMKPVAEDQPERFAGGAQVPRAEAAEGFMILTPQPVHPPRPAPDLDGLLAQFDTALAAFRSGDEPGQEMQRSGDPDPVQAFVARQTGGPVPSPLGGRMPDHQAELRAALDKLAKAHRKD